jgi:hypothetical protein
MSRLSPSPVSVGDQGQVKGGELHSVAGAVAVDAERDVGEGSARPEPRAGCIWPNGHGPALRVDAVDHVLNLAEGLGLALLLADRPRDPHRCRGWCT